jgi:hypothetical protein
MAEAYVSDARPSDLHNLEDECRREVSQRRAAYDKLVRDGRMRRNQADYRIMQMERLVTLLQALQHRDTCLYVRTTPNHISVLLPEQIGDWLADPAAYGKRVAAPYAGGAGAPAPSTLHPNPSPHDLLPTHATATVEWEKRQTAARAVDPTSSRSGGQRDLLVHAAARGAAAGGAA